MPAKGSRIHGSASLRVGTEPAQMLVHDASAWPVRLFVTQDKHWRVPVELGEAWDRPAVPFRVIPWCAPSESRVVRNRWRAAGASVLDAAKIRR